MKKGFSKITVFTIVLLFFAVLTVQLTTVGRAAESNVTVDVNVSTLSEITVTPAAINWTPVAPGTTGGLRYLNIQNTGSVNATDVYAYATTLDNETSVPYTTSSASAYSASGVLVFHNESDSRFYWAGRLEWNWTETVSNLVWPAGIDSASRVSEGFFRNVTNAFVWSLGNGTDGQCNTAGTKLALESNIDDGTSSTRSPTTTGISRDGGDVDYSYFSVNRAGNFLDGLCVAVDTTCTKFYAYKYDKRPGFTGCVNSQYLVRNLVPSEIEQITADAWIQKGMPAGNMKQAVWVFRAA